eukprot:COSAG06_NODE_43279_length_373_cov_1.098540_1_plen_86_part_10
MHVLEFDRVGMKAVALRRSNGKNQGGQEWLLEPPSTFKRHGSLESGADVAQIELIKVTVSSLDESKSGEAKYEVMTEYKAVGEQRT